MVYWADAKVEAHLTPDEAVGDCYTHKHNRASKPIRDFIIQEKSHGKAMYTKMLDLRSHTNTNYAMYY